MGLQQQAVALEHLNQQLLLRQVIFFNGEQKHQWIKISMLNLVSYNKISLILACLNVDFIHENPGHYTCDCVDSSDPCFADGSCVVTQRCPESNGKNAGINK